MKEKNLVDKKWSKEIPDYGIEIDGVRFKNLSKEQYELLYKLKEVHRDCLGKFEQQVELSSK